MKLGFIALAALIASGNAAAPASAQDWTGWYGGFSAGALTGGYHDEFDWTIKYQGVTLGGFAGYRGQINQVVWSLEGAGDVDFADEAQGDHDFNTNTALVSRLSARATLGLPVDRFLIYAGTGLGVGFQRVDPNASGFTTSTQPHLGIEAIAGVDLEVTASVFVRAEARYTAFTDAAYNLAHGDFRAGMIGTADAKIGVGLRF